MYKEIISAVFVDKMRVIDDIRTLNVMVKSSWDKDVRNTIYSMKDVMIAWLYKSGYCTRVDRQKQILTCNSWKYHGSGYDKSENCPKCFGTRVYKQTELYVYSFQVGEKRFGWHQPASRAIIKPTSFSNSLPEYDLPRHSLDDYGDVEQRYWNVIVFLVIHGMIRWQEINPEIPGRMNEVKMKLQQAQA